MTEYLEWHIPNKSNDNININKETQLPHKTSENLTSDKWWWYVDIKLWNLNYSRSLHNTKYLVSRASNSPVKLNFMTFNSTYWIWRVLSKSFVLIFWIKISYSKIYEINLKYIPLDNVLDFGIGSILHALQLSLNKDKVNNAMKAVSVQLGLIGTLSTIPWVLPFVACIVMILLWFLLLILCSPQTYV